jgi:RHS repeat-associated protein
MPNRQFNSGDYRYGFNGKENDNETVGTGEGTQDFGARIYNPALGRFLSVDPLTKGYPMLTPYQYASNTPIQCIDLDGLEGLHFTLTYNNKNVPKLELTDVLAGDFINNPPPKYFRIRYDGQTYDFSNPASVIRFAQDPRGYESNEARSEKGTTGSELAMYDMAFSAPFFANWLKGLSKVEGGAYKTLETAGKDRHHVISGSVLEKAESGVSKDEASAIRMDVVDHVLTGSFANTKASIAYRAKELALVKSGKFNEAWQMGVDDIIRTLKDQGKDLRMYEDAIEQATKHFKDKILPKLEEAYKAKKK